MVLVVGDISVDITAPLPAHPAVGEDCLSPELTFQCGGVALNGVAALLHYADGIIVGTGLKYDGVAQPGRIRRGCRSLSMRCGTRASLGYRLPKPGPSGKEGKF
ncbi:MAG: hypothetical protein ACXVZZ_05855 [Terriglobales bacterium]